MQRICAYHITASPAWVPLLLKLPQLTVNFFFRARWFNTSFESLVYMRFESSNWLESVFMFLLHYAIFYGDLPVLSFPYCCYILPALTDYDFCLSDIEEMGKVMLHSTVFFLHWFGSKKICKHTHTHTYIIFIRSTIVQRPLLERRELMA